MNHRQNAIVVFALDGISTLYSGVGTIVSAFFEVYPKIMGDNEGNFDLYAVTPYSDQNDSRINEEVFAEVSKQCQTHGGEMIYIPSLCHGGAHTNLWRGTENVPIELQWASTAISAAACLETLKKTKAYKYIFVISHDTLFLNIPKYLISDGIKMCWMPHSLSTIFTDHLKDAKMLFEEAGIKDLLKRNHKIGILSNLIRESLISHFDCKETDLISFYSGIYTNSRKYRIKRTEKEIFDELSIPEEKKLIFSWGRATAGKGIDTMLRGFIELKRRGRLLENFHLVLLCPDSTSIDSFAKQIMELKDSIEPEDCTLITKFDEEIPITILSSLRTRAVVIASRFETFGLCSLEALSFRNPAVSILYTKIPTFEEVLYEQPNTYPFEPGNETELAMVLEKVLIEVEEDFLLQRQETNFKLDPIYNIVNNYSIGLSQFFKNDE